MKKLILGFALAAMASAQAHFFFSEEMLDSNLKTYTEEEKAAIKKDQAVVKSVCFPENPGSKERPLYIASAGGPGTRKTTILEKFLKNHAEYADCIYLDPDPRALKYMVHTYISRSLSPLAIAEGKDYDSVIKTAYDKWRFGSTYICASLLEEAFQNRYDIAHGTTLTGDVVPKLLKTIKEGGYDITLLLCSCDNDFPVASITYRNQETRFYQSSPEDAIAKGKLFPQRMPTYFAYGDNLHFFWSDSLKTPERLAASYENGKFTIVDAAAWKEFGDKYEKDRALLFEEGKEIASWEDLIATLRR